MTSILEDLNAQFVALVAGGCTMPAAAVAAAITSGPFLPEDAKNAGLVDHIEHADFCKSYLEEKLGHGGHAPRYVPHASYIAPPGRHRSCVRRSDFW